MARPSTVQAGADTSRHMMSARFTFAALALLVLAGQLASPVRAAELPPVQSSEALAGLDQTGRVRVERALRRENFTLLGETRRKGQILIVTAAQQGISWRLVVDAATGEVIGRRPLAESATLPR
jgi:hypothetical protein